MEFFFLFFFFQLFGVFGREWRGAMGEGEVGGGGVLGCLVEGGLV